MHRKKLTAFVLISLVAVWFLAMGCDEDSNYDSRTVVYVSSVNANAPYMSDVLNQGDSVRTETGTGWVTNDDFVEEDWISVVIYNKPYNGLLNPSSHRAVGSCTDYYSRIHSNRTHNNKNFRGSFFPAVGRSSGKNSGQARTGKTW